METAFIIRSYFSFLQQILPPAFGLSKVKPLKGLAGEKSSSLRCGIFPRQTLHNPGRRQNLHVRNRNTGSKSRFMSNCIKNKRYENRSKPDGN